MIRPVDDPITQNFGDGATAGVAANSDLNSGMGYYVYLYGNYQPDGHTGQDYGAFSGTPIRAVTSGTVLHVGWLSGTYADNPWWLLPAFAGYCYVIDHGAFIGVYGHGLDGGTQVSEGQLVTEGQVIGLSGKTGAAQSPHLHFEILLDGYVLNSRYYGRADPETLFGGASMGPASSVITTPQEDTLSAAEVDTILTAIKNIAAPGEAGTREAGPLFPLAQDVAATKALIQPGIAGVQQAGAVYAALAGVKASGVSVDPAQLAASIAASLPADLANQVVTELGKALGGK